MSAYSLIYFIGFVITFFGFLLTFLFFKETDIEEGQGVRENNSNQSIFQLWKDVLSDINFWKYFLFAVMSIGMKMIFYMLSLIIPKIITY